MMHPMHFQTKTAIKSLLQAEIGACEIIPVSGGGSKAKLYSVTSAEKGSYYLKINNTRNTTDRLQDDALIYAWLSGKMEVPKVVFYKKQAHLEALCVTALEGKTLKDWVGILSPEAIISIYAKTLKALHAIPIEDCPIRRNLTDQLNKAKYSVAHHWVLSDDFEACYQQRSPEDLLHELLQKAPHDYELVFTHGDYCMDNLMVKEGKLSGLIDMGRGGVADKYQDIALAVRSIRHELGYEYIDQFYEAYGLEQPHQEKIEYYTLLDEFF
jgi:aminoglycoside phosphotransferase